MRTRCRGSATYVPEPARQLDTMLKESGDVKAAAALVRDASEILTGSAVSSTPFTDEGDDPMFPGKGERELRKAIAAPFLLLFVIVALVLWL